MKHIALLSACCLLICSCGKVAQHGAILNSSVSMGILENQVNTEELIHALADVQRGILNDRWEDIYTSVELEYRNSVGLDERDPLSREQRLEIATIAASARDLINGEISMQENQLLSDSRMNTALLVELNETVTLYLNSQEELDSAKSKLDSGLAEITGFSFLGIAETASEFMELLP